MSGLSKELDFHQLLCVYKALVFDITREVFDSKGYPIIHEKMPTNEFELCNKKYVDNAVSRLTPAKNSVTREDVVAIAKDHAAAERTHLDLCTNALKSIIKEIESRVNDVILKVYAADEGKDALSDSIKAISNQLGKLKTEKNDEINSLRIIVNDCRETVKAIPSLVTDQAQMNNEITRIKYEMSPSVLHEESLHLTVDLKSSSILKAVKDNISKIGLVKKFYRRVTITRMGLQLNEYDSRGELVPARQTKKLKKPFEVSFVIPDGVRQKVIFDQTPSVRDHLSYIVETNVFDSVIVSNDINQCFGNSEDSKRNNRERGNSKYEPILVRESNVNRIDVIIKFLFKIVY